VRALFSSSRHPRHDPVVPNPTTIARSSREPTSPTSRSLTLISLRLADAQRSGVANEAAKGGAATMFSKKTMSIEEARSILGVDLNATLEVVTGRYTKMFEANEKNGSFYLQSKIHRAKERIEAEFLGDGAAGEQAGSHGVDVKDEGQMNDAASSKNPNAGRGFAAGGVRDEDKAKK